MELRTYEAAKALAGNTIVASNSGGRTRRITFEHRPDRGIAARLFATDIVTFYPDHVTIRTDGYVTPTTFDGIATALDLPRVCVGTVKRVPTLFDLYRMSEGMQLAYSGVVVKATDDLTPLAPARRVR